MIYNEIFNLIIYEFLLKKFIKGNLKYMLMWRDDVAHVLAW